MTKPATLDIDVTRGDTYELYFGVGRNGSRINLTGGSVTGQVRATVDDTTVMGSFVCAITDQNTDPGGVYCRIEKTVTATFTSAGVYDLQVNMPNGDSKTVLAGKMNLIKDVTRSG